jgi:hypothetical protein
MKEDPIVVANGVDAKLRQISKQLSILQRDASDFGNIVYEINTVVQSYVKSLKPWSELRMEVCGLHRSIARRLRAVIIKFSWNYLEQKIGKSIQEIFNENADLKVHGLTFSITIVTLNKTKEFFCVGDVTDVIAIHIEGILSKNDGVLQPEHTNIDLLVRMALRDSPDNNLILTPVLSRPVKVSSPSSHSKNGTTFIKDCVEAMLNNSITAATIPAKIKLPFLATKASENRWQTDHDSYCLLTHLEAADDCVLSGHLFSFAKGISSNGQPIDLPEGVYTDVVIQVAAFSPMPATPKLNIPDVVPSKNRPDWADAEFHISTPRFVSIITSELKRQIYAASNAKSPFQSNDVGGAVYTGINEYREDGQVIKKFSWMGGIPVGWYASCVNGGYHFHKWNLEYRCDEWSPPYLLSALVGATGEFKIVQNYGNTTVNFDIRLLGTDKYNQVIPIPLGSEIEKIDYNIDPDFISFFVKYHDQN